MPKIAQFVTFFSVILLIDASAHYWFWARLVRDTAIASPWRQIATAAIVALAISLPLSMILVRTVPPGWGRIAFYAPMVWMGFSVFLIAFLGAADIARLFAWIASKVPGVPDVLFEQGPRLFFSRAVAASAFGMSCVLTVLAVFNASGSPGVRDVRVTLDRLPSALDGFTIVQITDLHMGPGFDREWLEDVVARANALKPDLIAVTGDLADGPVSMLATRVAPLEKLRAPAGVYFVTGNHEYYHGVRAWMAEVERLGIRVLGNTRVSVGRGGDSFDLAGVWDQEASRLPVGQRPDLGQALAGRNPSREVVLLAHQPRSVREASRHGVGLVLSGHTHGGQIWPFSYLVKLQQPFLKGLHRVGDTQVYVSQGTGLWGPPMRLGSSSEITRITLTSPNPKGAR
jgi:predicted MPP superfamily phosphohydrolase